MTFRIRLFVILLLAGFAGILSFLLVDLSELLAIMPVTEEARMPFSPLLLKLLSLVQPTVLLSIAVFVGIALAPKVGLFAPAFEAWARRDNFATALKPQIIPGLIGGAVGGGAIILSWVLGKPFLPAEFVVKAVQMNRLLPVPTRLLYGGITEELLLRWGVMTFMVWAAWRLFQKRRGQPRGVYIVIAIVISSVIFGIGHLPLVVALGSNLTLAIVVYVVSANSVFGLIAGYLYWRKGLEAAIVAHMLAHVVLVSAIVFEK
ncbi:MAG TPA: CPBP family intramembrane glutamic endopeptidase [Blastocatellia bacterium]|nr:CPBP family intramembrane glutamic endopeptidase [Blastocatellia bacterium]